jgi:hypothetical protein
MTRTVEIKLDDHLMADAEKLAAESGRSLSEVVEDALREIVIRSWQKAERPRITLPTSGGSGILPGVDLSDNSAVQDLMDGFA